MLYIESEQEHERGHAAIVEIGRKTEEKQDLQPLVLKRFINLLDYQEIIYHFQYCIFLLRFEKH